MKRREVETDFTHQLVHHADTGASPTITNLTKASKSSDVFGVSSQSGRDIAKVKEGGGREMFYLASPPRRGYRFPSHLLKSLRACLFFGFCSRGLGCRTPHRIGRWELKTGFAEEGFATVRRTRRLVSLRAKLLQCISAKRHNACNNVAVRSISEYCDISRLMD